MFEERMRSSRDKKAWMSKLNVLYLIYVNNYYIFGNNRNENGFHSLLRLTSQMFFIV